jgi:hypothetical protein
MSNVTFLALITSLTSGNISSKLVRRLNLTAGLKTPLVSHSPTPMMMGCPSSWMNINFINFIDLHFYNGKYPSFNRKFYLFFQNLHKIWPRFCYKSSSWPVRYVHSLFLFDICSFLLNIWIIKNIKVSTLKSMRHVQLRRFWLLDGQKFIRCRGWIRGGSA